MVEEGGPPAHLSLSSTIPVLCSPQVTPSFFPPFPSPPSPTPCLPLPPLLLLLPSPQYFLSFPFAPIRADMLCTYSTIHLISVHEMILFIIVFCSFTCPLPFPYFTCPASSPNLSCTCCLPVLHMHMLLTCPTHVANLSCTCF